jgi:hypothetical protein
VWLPCSLFPFVCRPLGTIIPRSCPPLLCCAQVIKPHDMDARVVEAAGVPLPAKHVHRIEESVDWEDFVWGPIYVRVRGVQYTLLRCLYVPYSVAG